LLGGRIAGKFPEILIEGAIGFKELPASAPLEGIEPERPRSTVD